MASGSRRQSTFSKLWQLAVAATAWLIWYGSHVPADEDDLAQRFRNAEGML